MKPRTEPMARTPIRRFKVVTREGAPVVTFPQRKAAGTGFSPAVKLAVRSRAGGGDPDDAHCEATGVWLGRHGGEIQHRDARGMGGTSLEVTNSVVNAALLSMAAHRLAESRDPGMNAEGFWLKNGEDPAATPILLHVTEQSGITAWLTPAGGYSYEPPGDDAA
jgi:hypothetical protein